VAKKRKPQPNADRGNTWLVYGGLGLIAVMLAFVLVQVTRPAPPEVTSFYPDVPRGMTETGHPTLGDPNAPVTLLIYEDLACPNCRRFVEDIEPQVIEQYVRSGQVRLEVYTMSFVSNVSLLAAQAAYCVADQGLFWEYRDLLYQMQGAQAFTRGNLVEWATQVGADRSALLQCLDNGTHREALYRQSQVAFNFGVRGTPTFEVSGQRYEGVHPFESSDPAVPGMKQILDEALKEAQP